MTSFYTEDELVALGLKSYGTNVLISRKCSIYGAQNIEIGDNVRIDDFCILSGKIKLGSHIHISAYVALYGAEGIELEDYTGISPRTTIYSAMDDFSGNYLIGPIHDESKTNVTGAPVKVHRFAHIGANTVIYPGIDIPEGTVIGAMSMVSRSNLEPWSIYVGVPVYKIKDRVNNLLKLI